MRVFKLSVAVFSISLFLMSCNTDQPQQTAITETYPNDAVVAEEIPIDDYWAKDNFDLQRVGNLLERSDDPQEFEAYLNDDDGLNNLDLNGDGYADYISVQEFEDRDSNSRGLSLFSRFGPDLIQEIAQIFFYRDEPRYPGSRVLVYGNDQLYGDNHYYETNWLDRSVGLTSYLFSDRDSYYRSPYYYDNYPSDYTVYEVVETPVYRTRIEQLYPEIVKFELIDYKVRIVDQGHGTDAITRVLIETSDGESSWVTVGVGHNVIEASWEALIDGLTFGLRRHQA